MMGSFYLYVVFISNMMFCGAFFTSGITNSGTMKKLTVPQQFQYNKDCGSLVNLKMSETTAASDELSTSPSKPDYGEIPSYLPTEMGVDWIPLATCLSLGEYEEADQITRDNLIKIAGSEAVRRNFVYWTDVKTIPNTDLCTMERLWLQFTDGTQGYSIQKRVWDLENGNFDRFIRRIGWTTVENGEERKLKWFTSPREFIYDPLKAPKGHLPLTSALRGTQLMRALMEHPVWEEYDWKNYKDLEWKA